MTLLDKLKLVFQTSGLTEREYNMITEKLQDDNREKLFSLSFISAGFLLVMLLLSLMIESIAHSRGVYLVGLCAALFLSLFARIGKMSPRWSTVGIYLFTSGCFLFGIYQGVITSPQEQTASFMALLLAIPFWFTMPPLKMTGCIYLYTGIFIIGCIRFKTGYVRTADIVNALAYASISAFISTYATCSKCKRFYAEHLTDRMGKTDVLTGLGNRNAYIAHASQYADPPLPEELTLICLDVNELKAINDSMGHHVGDELLCGAADCITAIFNSVGTCYRTGGDEFIVLCRVERDQLDPLCSAFERTVATWKGSWGRPLRISYGCASAWELPGEPLSQLSKLADHRLYEAKNIYYSVCGLDRRGHQQAYGALCESYIKILHVNLTQDSCRVIRAEHDDFLSHGDTTISLSQWVKAICESGEVHPDDAAAYTAKMDLSVLCDHFRSGKRSIHIFYRRMDQGDYRAVMTELIRAPEYSNEEQVVYLYVKNIDRQG